MVVSSFAAQTSRRLPRGWRHLAFQFVIWMGFYALYQVARGSADRSVANAFQNGEWVLRQERELGALFEPAVQRVVDTSSVLVTLTSYTYWLSQFAVVGITLLWVYFRHHERFAAFRNWIIAANLVGLVGYIFVPTAPPRMFPEWGFVDTLAQYSSRQPRERRHRLGSQSVRGDAEPARDGRVHRRHRHVRARPLEARQGALARVAGLGRVRGHLDREPLLARRRRRGAAGDRHGLRAPSRSAGSASSAPHERRRIRAEPARVSQLDRVKQEYTQSAREILARSMRGVAKTKLTPDMLTLAGVTLCLAGAVLVGFEERNEKLFFWLGGALFVVGSVADILDGALARAASKGTVFGAFLDSTFDRLGEAAMLAAIGLVFMRDGNEVALVATFAAVIGSFLVSYTRAKAEALGLRAATSASARASSASCSSRRASASLRGVGSSGRSTCSPRWPGSPCSSGCCSSARQLRELAEQPLAALL